MRKKQILIVDDILENVQLAGTILQQENYSISISTSGKEALKIAEQRKFDLILLDIMMPEMDGFEVCRRLKENNVTKDIPVIFLTAKSEVDSIKKGFQIGAQDYVTKPFSIEELLARVKTHIELKEQKDRLESMNKYLEDKVRERTEELRKVNQRLLKLEKAKSNFLNLIGHEMRTPLSGVTSFTMLFEMSNPTEKQKEYLGYLKEATERLYKFSEAALLITSLNTERFQMQMNSYHVHDLVNHAVKDMQKKASKKNVIIDNKVEDKNLKVWVDSQFIKKSLQIVIENSIRFTPEGSSIEITANFDEDSVWIDIKDHGKGFSKEDMDNIFEYFSTGDVNHHNEGFGLGLATLKLIMEANFGEVKISNREDGQGAHVKLIFSLNRS